MKNFDLGKSNSEFDYNQLAIGITLYNPDIELLKNNIQEYLKITKNIYFVDNGSNNVDDIKRIINDNFIVKYNKDNLGIAKALNQLMDISISNGNNYLLTLDQDSVVKKECVELLTKYVNYDDVAIVCPTINDLNKDKIKPIKEEYKYIDRCITSGSLMNLNICKKIARFDEKMFIDYVDFDYCKNIQISGYKIIQIRDAILDHTVGNRIKRKFIFWDVYPTNYANAKRYYYFARNIKYYLKKYNKKLTLREYAHDKIHLIWKYINVNLYENNKKEKLKMYIKGLKDYKKMFE